MYVLIKIKINKNKKPRDGIARQRCVIFLSLRGSIVLFFLSLQMLRQAQDDISNTICYLFKSQL